MVLKDFHELATQAEKQDRTELKIERTANNEFVAAGCHHRLNRNSKKVAWTSSFIDRRFDLLVGTAGGISIVQMKVYASHIRLVRNGFGEELQDHRIADFVCCLYGIIGVNCEPCFNHRNAVGPEQFLSV